MSQLRRLTKPCKFGPLLGSKTAGRLTLRRESVEGSPEEHDFTTAHTEPIRVVLSLT